MVLGGVALLFSAYIGAAETRPKTVIDSLNHRLSLGVRDSMEKLQLYKALSVSYWKVSPDSSIYYGNRSLLLAENLNIEEEKADALHNLGVAYFYSNSFETSLDFLYQSLAIREKKADQNKIATTLNSIGNINYALNNVSNALDYYNRSLDLTRKANNTKMETSILINLGSLYATVGRWDTAFLLLNQSVGLLEKLNDSVSLGSALNNLALIHRENKDYAKSLEYDTKALKINKKLGRLWEISYISNTLGETYLLMKNYGMAYAYFSDALQAAEMLGTQDVLLFSYRSLTKYYSAIGDYERFAEFFKKYDATKDGIFTTENTRSIAEMQVKYDTEHKEKENALQKLQITKERSLRNSFIFISLIVIIIVVILLFRFRVKKRLNRELESLVKLRTRDLLANQSKLKEAQRIGRSGSWDWDLVHDRLSWSDELPVILGLTGKNINWVTVLRKTHPDDRPALHKIFKKEFNGFGDIVFDIRLVSDEKITKYISVHGEVSKDDQGHITLVQGTIQDITERKLAELALRESEELYRKLISASPDAVFKINADGMIVFASQQSKLLFRLKHSDEMIGTPITDWIVKTDRLRMVKNIQSRFLDDNEKDAHYVLQRKDGSTFSGELKTAIIYAAEGNAKGLIAVVRNITDRKQMEQRILRNTIETEERERERFSEDLHDGLGPLLSAVKIHLELISSRMGNPVEQGRFIKMTDDLLQESIKSTREIANNLTPNLLNDFGLIEALSVYVEKINKTNTILIDFKVDEPFPALHKQTEVALYRVVCELINNTLKHASAAKIMIKLVKDEKQIEVRYSDNGIGCDVQKMLSSPSKGLGLSNIISRVKSINGNCTFSSEPGHHFTSVISVAIADESEKDNPQNPEKS